jgi:hypothetical protein
MQDLSSPIWLESEPSLSDRFEIPYLYALALEIGEDHE